MSENALYRGRKVGIGTCENLYYLRADQAHLVEQAPASLNVQACLDVVRFRFPWPDEDKIEPGGFGDAFRSLPVPGVKPGKQVGHRKDGCDGDAAIVQQRYWQGALVLVCQCTGCGEKYRLEELADAQPVIDGLNAMADQKSGDGDQVDLLAAVRLRLTARRVAAGYPTPVLDVATATERVLVNQADWDGPELPDGWIIVNAPRPLLGEKTWNGPYRHGVFYAAGPNQLPKGRDREHAERIVASWAADDAWPVVFTTNAEIARQVLAKFAEYGYATEDEAGVTIAEQAACMGLPWHEGPERTPEELAYQAAQIAGGFGDPYAEESAK